MVFENRMLRRTFGNQREDAGENYMMKNLIICTLHQILLRAIKSSFIQLVLFVEQFNFILHHVT
jgi:hypothetical protein